MLLPERVPNTPSEADDTIEQFWDDWRSKRKESRVTIELVAKRANTNKTALYDLGKQGKKAFPGKEFVDKLLGVVNLPEAERQALLDRYLRLEAARQVEPPAKRRPSWLQFWLAVGAAMLVAATVPVVIFVMQSAPPPASAPYAAIRVQNMVALGANDLRPDTTPAYLSTRPERRCAAKGCTVAGTEMDTGVLLVATCQTRGDELVNFNLDSASADNPHRARSDRWYKVRLADGQTGFLSEVYVDPHDRGGLGLASCAR